MYQPRRASRAVDAPRPDVEAFEGAPRRATRRPVPALLSKVAPAVVSLTVLAGAGGVALTVNAEQAATAVPAPARATDQTSRSDARAALGADAEAEADGAPMGAGGTVETPAPTAEPAPEPTADAAFVGGAWSDAFGTVTGTQFAQKALEVRAQAADGAAALGTVGEGAKVSVTDKAVDGWTQVVLDAKLGWVRTDLLGAKAPVKEAPAGVSAARAEGSAPVAARSGGKLHWPTAGSIGSRWGMRKHPILGYTRLHGGVDIGGRIGQPIYAAEDGVVTKAARGHNSGSGNNVRIDHGTISGKSVETAYLHMQQISVKVGQKVKRGQVIGTVGNTGLSTSPHLHFSLYLNGGNSNPAAWLG